jgi:hypothetical protein
MSVRRFVAVCVVHRLAVELGTVIDWARATLGRWSVITVPVIQVMVDMAIEMVWSVEPWSGAYKDAARKPFRAVVTVWCAGVWRLFIVTVWASGRSANFHGYLRRGPIRGRKKQARSKGHSSNIFQSTHNFTSCSWRQTSLQLVVSSNYRSPHLSANIVSNRTESVVPTPSLYVPQNYSSSTR